LTLQDIRNSQMIIRIKTLLKRYWNIIGDRFGQQRGRRD
jgi:hypothetical protein